MIKISFYLTDIEYGEIAEKFLPMVIERLSDREDSGRLIQILSGIGELPGAMAKTALHALPDAVKEELTVYFLEKYQEKLTEKMNGFMEENQIRVHMEQMEIERIRESAE